MNVVKGKLRGAVFGVAGSLFIACMLVLPGRAYGQQTIYWDGSASPGNVWSSTNSWSTAAGSILPPSAVPGLGDYGYFSMATVTSPQTVRLDGNQSAYGLIFSSTATTSLLGGTDGAPAANTLTLNAGGIRLTALAGAVTIGSSGAGNVPLTLADSQTWYTASATQLSVLGNVTGAAGVAETLTLGGYGMTTITGVIADGAGGSVGLVKTGNGFVRLSNSGNTYSGTTRISQGTVAISSNGSLGTATSTVVVSTDGSYNGAQGGTLLLDGSRSGFTLSRNLSLQGSGQGGAVNSQLPIAAVANVGNNTLPGTVSTGVGNFDTRLANGYGRLVLGGTLATGTSGSVYTIFNADGAVGIGSYAITGALSGSNIIQKNGGGTLFLSATNSSGFGGFFGFGPAAGVANQNTIRITGTGVLGTRSDTSVFRWNSNQGVLEVRMDAPVLQTTTGSNVMLANVQSSNAGTGAYTFIDHAPGTTAVSGKLTVADYNTGNNTILAVASRNGYGLSTPHFGQAAAGISYVNSFMSGDLVVTGTLGAPGVAAGAMTVNNSSNIISQGPFLHGNGSGVTKNLGGLLLIAGASNLSGTFTLNAGALAITDFRSIGTSPTVNLGSSSTSSALIIGTGSAASAADLVTSRTINLAGTTGGGWIFANQTSGSIVLNGNLTATGNGAKTLTLGGTSTAANTINGSIPNGASSTVTSLTKFGPGTWVLAGTNSFTGGVTVSDGTLRLAANSAVASGVLVDTVGITFNESSGYAGGTLEYSGTGGPTTEVVGALTPTAGGNTIRLSPGTGTVGLTAASLGTVNGAATVNIVGSGSGTFAFTTAPTTNNITNAGLYYNGADFAYVVGNNTAVRTPVYGTDSDFAVASSALTAGQSNRLDGSFSSGAVAIDSLKVNGSQALTMTGMLTVRTAATANATGGILQTGGSGTIAGTGVTTGGSGALVIRVDGSSDSLELSAPIAATTTGGLTKSGAGLLLLSAANAQTGATTINEGTVRLGAGGRLGADNQPLTIRQAGTLDLNGISTQSAIGAFANMGTVTNSGASAATLTVGNNDGTGTSYGLLQDGVSVLNVTKVGAGGQSWLGASTYTGVTRIDGGSVTVDVLANIGAASGIGSGTSANNAGSLVFTSGTLMYQGNLYAGTTGIQYGGPTGSITGASRTTDRLFTLSGTSASAGATIGSNAPLSNAVIWTNTNAVAFGSGTAQTITFSGTSTGDNAFRPQIIDNSISGAATSVTKVDSGIWVLDNGANSYTGPTTISGGYLGVANGGGLPANSPLQIGASGTAVLMMSGTFTRSLAASPAANNSTVTLVSNAGFGAYGDKLVVAIGGTASPTALTWGSGGFLGSSGTLVFNGPTTLNEVEFRNSIDLGSTARTVVVNDNADTGADFATIAGNLSGSGGLSKAGSGVLVLTGNNTYTGATTVSAGFLAVQSLGQSGASGATSVGNQQNGNLSANSVFLNGGSLQYVGSGETSDRLIRLGNSATISADGGGPLTLTNVTNDTSTAKTLSLFGSNPGDNTITSPLSNNGAGTLSLTVGGGSRWILTGTNQFTGSVTLDRSTIGIGSDSALGNGGTITSTGGVLFAYGGDRTLSNPITIPNTGSNGLGVTGDYSLTMSNTITISQSVLVGQNFSNTLAPGKTWTIAQINSTGAGGTTITFTGDGDTQINGPFTVFGNLAKSGTGTLNLKGSATYAGTTTVSRGVLLLSTTAAVSGTAARPYTVNAAGSLATGYALDQALLNKVVTTSGGVVALGADSANNLDLSSGGASLTAASLGAAGSTTRVYSGTLTPNGTAYRLGGGGGTLDFQSQLTGANTLAVGGDITGLGGTVILSNTANSFTGKTTVQMGTLQIASIANVSGGNSALGAPTTTANGTIDLGSTTSSGTLRYVGTTSSTSNRVINMAGTTGGAAVEAAGTGALVLTGANTATGVGTKTFTLTGTSTAANSIGSIAGASVSVEKTGNGLWRLSGASSFAGQMRVLEGTVIADVGTDTTGNGVFGAATAAASLPQLGSTTGSGTAAILLGADGVQAKRGLQVAALTGGYSQTAILGGANTSGTSTFFSGMSIRLGRDITLQSGSGGTVQFSNTWQDAAGGNSPAVAFSIGTPGNTGNVLMTSFLPSTVTAVNLRYGTLRLGTTDVVGPATPLNLCGAGASGTFDLNGYSQTLSSVSFSGTSSTVGNSGGSGSLRLANSGSTATVTVIDGTGHQITSSVALDDATTFNVANASKLLVSSVIGTGNGGAKTLTKSGLGTLELTGASTYAGTTAVANGILRFNSVAAGANAQALGAGTLVNLGAAATSSGEIDYFGNGGTLEKNIVALGNGRNRIRNSGSGTLTLSGTLTKDGTILELAQGTFNVTGRITGTSVGTSDLFVNGGSVTLTNTNNDYNGPTYVYGGGSLTLGVSNVIPSNSSLILGGTGSDSGIGTINTGTFTDTLASLTTSSLGSTVVITINGAAAGGLTTTGNVTFGAGTDTLNLSLTSLSLGKYQLLTYQGTRSGTFDTVNITGSDSRYTLVYGSGSNSSIDLQMKANQAATFTLTPAAAGGRVLVGGSTQLSGGLANSSPTGAAALAWSPVSTGSLSAINSSLGSTIAAGSTSTITAWISAGNTAGTQNWSLINTDNNAITTTSTASGSITVVDYRTYSPSPSPINLGRFLITGAASGATTISSSGLFATTESGTLGSAASNNGLSLAFNNSGSRVFDGSSSPQTAGYSVSGTWVGAAGAISGTFGLGATNELSGASAVNVGYTGNALNQRSFSVSNSGTINLGNFLRTASVTGSATISSSGLNANTANATLGSFSGTSTNGFSLATLDSPIFNGGTSSQSAVYTLSGSAASAGAINGTFTSAVSAEFGSIAPVTVSLVGTAYNPAIASFTAVSATTSWFVNIGEFNQNTGNHTAGFSIFNLFTGDQTYAADLMLESITPIGTPFGSLSTNLATFDNLAAGLSNNWLASLSSLTTGSFSNQYQLNFVSAKNGQSLGGSQSMTLTVTGIIVVPEPAGIALAGIGIAAAAYALRRRR